MLQSCSTPSLNTPPRELAVFTGRGDQRDGHGRAEGGRRLKRIGQRTSGVTLLRTVRKTLTPGKKPSLTFR